MSSIRKYIQAGLAVAMAVAAGSCVTQRKELGPVRSKFGIEAGKWGGQGGGANEKEIKETYANAGWEFDDEGKITKAKNENLYTEKSPFSGKRGYAKKEARLKNRELTSEVYRTPEYLVRQKYHGAKSAEEGKRVSREADFDENRTAEAGRQARESGGDSPGFLNGLNPFRNRTARETGGTFKTATNRQGTSAQANAAIPKPGPLPRNGDQRGAAMTMDDVKKMLHPEAFD